MIQPIRAVTVADADSLAALHAASWRSVYRGILSDETLGAGLDAERRDHWRARLVKTTDRDVVLMVDGVAFIAVWAEGDPGFGAYIDNLHVHPEHRSGGIGRRLLGRAAQLVAERGQQRAYLWVFDANLRAIAFYCSLGGEVTEHGFDTIDGAQVAHSRIVWRDIARLAESCHGP